jgi:hypothetical protein
VTLWLPSLRDAVLVGSASPLRLEPARHARAFDDGGTRHNLDAAYLETPEALLGTLLLGRAGLERFAGDAPRITDERPHMEFFLGHGGNMRDADILTLLDAEAAPPAAELGIDGELLARVLRENRALRLHVRGRIAQDAEAAREAIRLAAGTEFFLYPLGCSRRQLDAASSESARARRLRCESLLR